MSTSKKNHSGYDNPDPERQMWDIHSLVHISSEVIIIKLQAIDPGRLDKEEVWLARHACISLGRENNRIDCAGDWEEWRQQREGSGWRKTIEEENMEKGLELKAIEDDVV